MNHESASSSAVTPLPLQGIRVLDLTQAVAGPFCTQILADFGAEVVKVESPRGDIGRFVGPNDPEYGDPTMGGVFQNVNRNKTSIAVDLKRPEGAEIVRRLVRDADVLVENFSAGVLDRLGLGYDELRHINERLIYTSIRGFGDTAGGESPYMSWPAFDIVAQAMGGIMGLTGEGPDRPLRTGGAIGDTVPGIYAALGTLVALRHRDQTGVGQYVDIAMADAVLSVSEVAVNEYSHRQVVAQPRGNRLPGVAPFDTFQASDGTIALGAPHRPQWQQLCAVMQRPDLLDDPRFAEDRDRAARVDEVGEIVGAWVAQHTVAELTQLLGGRVPFAPVLRGDQIFSEPHFQVRDMLPTVERADGKPVHLTGVVPKLSASPGTIRSRAPRIGEGTEQILEQLGYSPEQITELLASGAAAG